MSSSCRKRRWFGAVEADGEALAVDDDAAAVGVRVREVTQLQDDQRVALPVRGIQVPIPISQSEQRPADDGIEDVGGIDPLRRARFNGIDADNVATPRGGRSHIKIAYGTVPLAQSCGGAASWASCTAISSVTVPVGSSFTPSSLQFTIAVATCGSVAVILASVRGSEAVKHQCKLVEGRFNCQKAPRVAVRARTPLGSLFGVLAGGLTHVCH